ncbi:hypothetical protein B0H16DRAFT_1687938, partial [Mycena metata]
MAMKHSQHALDFAQLTGNTREQSWALQELSWLNSHLGDYTASQGYAQKGQKVASISGNLYAEAAGLYYQAVSLHALGNNQ